MNIVVNSNENVICWVLCSMIVLWYVLLRNDSQIRNIAVGSWYYIFYIYMTVNVNAQDTLNILYLLLSFISRGVVHV